MSGDKESFGLETDMRTLGLGVYSKFTVSDDGVIGCDSLTEAVNEIQALDNALDRPHRPSFVYVWVGYDLDTDRDRALYVGSTKDIMARFSSHIASLNSNKYPERTSGIRTIINTNGRPGRVYIYGRVADPIIVFGQAVAGHEVEEALLISKFKPYWNKSGNSHGRFLRWPPYDPVEDATS